MKTAALTRAQVDRQLALSDFRAGFLAAVEVSFGKRQRGRALMDEARERHWRAGYAAGGAALRAACGEYEHKLTAGEVRP